MGVGGPSCGLYSTLCLVMFISLAFREGLIRTSRPAYEPLDAFPIGGVFTVALQLSFNF